MQGGPWAQGERPGSRIPKQKQGCHVAVRSGRRRYAILCSLFALATALCGQSFQGSLRGRIVDPKAATIPRARITIVDEATGASRSTLASDRGEYTFAALTPATYTVIAEAPGFKKRARAGVAVSTQTAVTIDLVMELGQVTERVNTADASTGQVIDSRKLATLPNLGRNPFGVVANLDRRRSGSQQ